MKAEDVFLRHVKSECEKYNVTFLAKKGKSIKLTNGSYVGGYFDSVMKELAYPTQSKYYLQYLTHEFSHMQQWHEKCDLWLESEKYEYDISNWLAGKPIENIFSKIDTLKLLELDCEKRTVKNIKKFHLPIDIPTYIQTANSYILFHNYMKETRKWCVISPGDIRHKSLWSICPNTFKPVSYYASIPKKIYKQFVLLDI